MNYPLLKVFSKEMKYNTGCVIGPPEEFSNSKFFFIDMNNFEEIKSTKNFKENVKHIILEIYIIIQTDEKAFVYDINSLNFIENIRFQKRYNIFYKFANKYIIINCSNLGKSIITIYKIETNNLLSIVKLNPLKFQYLLN